MCDYNTLSIHTFRGQRFEDHGLDLEVFPELAAYHKIVVETAKELWRRQNPDKERLKKNIEDDFRLKVFELQQGSVAVPIRRATTQLYLVHPDDILSQAVNLVHSAIERVDTHQRLPEDFPKNVIPLFGSYGKLLRDDEYIQHKNVHTGSVATYSRETREEFEKRCLDGYTDDFDIVARLVMARVHKPKISVLLDDGEEVEAPFNDDDKGLVFKALAEHDHSRVRLVGKAVFSPQGDLVRIIELEKFQIEGGEISEAKKTVKSFWKSFLDIADRIPEEARKSVPTDSAINLDKYLYGCSE